jgi:hypothetical protein
MPDGRSNRNIKKGNASIIPDGNAVRAITSGLARQATRHNVAGAEASPRLGALNRRAKPSGRKTKIGSPTQLGACLFGRDVSVGLRDVIDARIAVVDGQQRGIGRRIHMNGRRI